MLWAQEHFCKMRLSSTAPDSEQATAKPSKLQFTLTVATVEEVSAAEAVVAGLYGVQHAYAQLADHQLVQALVIADMIGATAVVQHICTCLKAAAQSQQGISEAALHTLASQPAWPQSLQQLLPVVVTHAKCFRECTDLAALLASNSGRTMQQTLLGVFADLQAVCRDPVLRRMLLQLPLAAMQLLLSSDQLRVPSEDTIMYIAQRYVGMYPQEDSKSLVRSALAPLIRAPHLSDVMLHRAVLCADSVTLLMRGYIGHLQQLMGLRRSSGDCSYAQGIAKIKGAPSSWHLSQRQLLPAVAETVRLGFPVQQLREACQNAYATQKRFLWQSPLTAPVSGIAWSIGLYCIMEGGGVNVSVLIEPHGVPQGFFYGLKFVATRNGHRIRYHVHRQQTRNFGDWFKVRGVGCMAGGWDEAAWAAAGLPVTGDLVFELEVLEMF